MTWLIRRDPSDDYTPQFYIWGICDIVEGVVGVLTFGYVQLDLAQRWISWYLDRIEKKKAQDAPTVRT